MKDRAKWESLTPELGALLPEIEFSSERSR